jgi:serine/threonine protein kinase
MDFPNTPFVAGVQLNGRYDILSPLNHGSFGVVVLAKDRLVGRLVAIKCLNTSSSAQGHLKFDDRSEELAIHSRIGHHTNVVNLLDSFSSDTHTFIVLEYCSQGDLYEAIRQDRGPKETEHVRSFMLQLVKAVDYLHKKGVYHRDLKPENIFLTEDGIMKLGDFGLATTQRRSTEAAVGSDRYMAPEQYDTQGGSILTAKADVWSVGICMLNILFSRNPFGVPAESDCLFLDFVRDRQSLFDIFPNMHNDTFEVLSHCLQIDPKKRDLTKVQDALERAVCFTTDDESLDEYCTVDRDVVKTTADREPLRTPSIKSPTHDTSDSFPWTRQLHMTTPKSRQLSIIHDNVSEDLMFPDSHASSTDWFSKADTQSIESTVDSGLGVSIDNDSPNSVTSRSRPVAIASSMPVFGRASSTFQSLFGKKKSGFESKSWSDLQDEEDEEYEREQRSRAPLTNSTTLSQVGSEESGRATPRALGPTTIEQRSSSNESSSSGDDDNEQEHISAHTGFVFEEDVGRAVTPTFAKQAMATPTRRSLLTGLDRWAVLGDRRRGGANASPSRTPAISVTSTPAIETKRRLSRPSSWRRPSWKKSFVGDREVKDSVQSPNKFGMSPHKFSSSPNKGGEVLSAKEWNKSKDWRNSNSFAVGSPLKVHESQLDGAAAESGRSGSGSGSSGSASPEESEEEQWIGGWRSLQI